MNAKSASTAAIAAASSAEHARGDRDEAELTLRRLLNDPHATKDDKLNASLSLVGIVQRRGDHREALQQLDAIVVDERSDAALQIIICEQCL